jgi:hypothetical protein
MEHRPRIEMTVSGAMLNHPLLRNNPTSMLLPSASRRHMSWYISAQRIVKFCAQSTTVWTRFDAKAADAWAGRHECICDNDMAAFT